MASSGIVSRAAHCERILSYLHIGAKTEAEKTWVETQSQRLDVWSETLGVRAHAKYSIEHRLASNQEVSTIVKQLLDALSLNLRQYYSIATLDTLPPELNKELESDGETSDSESSNGSTASDAFEPTLEEVAARVQAGLTRLGHLAVRIRREGVKRAAKAARDFVPVDTLGEPLEPEFRSCARASLLRAFPPDRHNGDSIQLLSANPDAPVAPSTTLIAPAWPVPQPDAIDLERAPQQVTKADVPPYVMPEYLRERFVDTMVRRWKRICYNRKHAQELAGLTNKPATVNDSLTSAPKRLLPGTEVTRAPVRISQASVKPQKVSTAKTVMTEYSVLDPATKINMNVDVQQPSKSIITGVKAGDLRYPKPPDVAKGIDIFSCPLCKLPLPIQFLNKRQWQLHVMQDLAPYFCLIRKCHSHAAIYSTHEEWLEHVRTEHMESSWLCNSCDQEPAFSDPKAFEEHFQQAHSEEAGLTQLPFLVKLAEKKEAYMYTECYFCGFVPASYEDDRSNEDAQKLIKEHMVADHMKAFALDCLPWDYAGAGGNSLYQDSQSRDSGSEEAREDILHDTALTQMLQQSEDVSNEVNDHPASITTASLASIKDRWDNSWNLRQMTQNWLENVVDVVGSPDDDVAQWDSQQRGVATVPVTKSKKRELRAQPFAETADRLRDVHRARDSESVRTYVISKAKAEIAKKTTHSMDSEDTPLNKSSMINTEVVQPVQDATRTIPDEDTLRSDRELRIYSLIENQDVSGIVQWIQENTLTFGNLDLPWEGQPLHAAVFTGNAEVVKVLLTVDQANQHLVGGVGSALSLAVRLKHTTIIDMLLAQAHSSVVPLATHAAPLAVACALGDLELVEKLAVADDAQLGLHYQFDVEAVNECPHSSFATYPIHIQMPKAGTTFSSEQPILTVNGSLLMIAALYNHEHLVRYLARRAGGTADDHLVRYDRRNRRELQEREMECNTRYSSALGLVAEANNGAMVSCLLSIGASVDILDSQGHNALDAAAHTDSGDALKPLLKHIHFMANRQDLLNDAFNKACHNGFPSTVRMLHDAGAMINEPGGGSIALEHACRRADVSLARYLLEAGADVAKRPQSDKDVVAIACSRGDVEVLELLLSHGASPDVPGEGGLTSLMRAAGDNNVDCLVLLLLEGASIDRFDQDGWTALHYAAELGCVQAAETLLAYGALVDHITNDGDTPLYMSIRSASLEVARVLLQNGARTDLRSGQWEETPLILATRYDHLDIVRLLLDHQAPIDTKDGKGRTAVMLACLAGYAFVVRLLIESGARTEDVFEDGTNLLSMTIAARHIQCSMVLLESGLQPDKQDEWNSALLMALEQEDTSCLATLLTGADIECRNELQETPLMVATRLHHHINMELLVKAGASNIAMYGVSTPLHWAAQRACGKCLEIILTHEKELQIPDNSGTTALHMILVHGSGLDCLRHLADRGLLPKTVDADGETTLMNAIRHGSLEMIAFLSRRGGGLDIVSHHGDTALILAAINNYSGVVEKLLRVGANAALRAGRHGYQLTALVWALVQRSFDAACCLISFEAPMDITTLYMPILSVIESGFFELIRSQNCWFPRSSTQLSRSDAATIGDMIVKQAQALKLAGDPLAVLSRAQVDILARAARKARERARERTSDRESRREQRSIESIGLGTASMSRESNQLIEAASESLREPWEAIDGSIMAYYKVAKKERDYALTLI